MREDQDLNRLAGVTGTIAEQELRASPGYPSEEDLTQGPTVVIECSEEIPCNPCETVCKKGAIVVGEPITNLPRLEAEKCTGCGLCLPICPGLAIFMVDAGYSEDEAAISFPHEYLPLPAQGDEVQAVNRRGEVVSPAKVLTVRHPRSYDHTPIVTIAVAKKYLEQVRGMKPLAKGVPVT